MILIVITKQSKACSQPCSLLATCLAAWQAMSLVSGLREHPLKVHYSSFQIATGLYRPVSWQQANDIGLVAGVNESVAGRQRMSITITGRQQGFEKWGKSLKPYIYTCAYLLPPGGYAFALCSRQSFLLRCRVFAIQATTQKRWNPRCIRAAEYMYMDLDYAWTTS